jgi:hypothetical protein
MAKHKDYVVKEQLPGRTVYECGCIFINGSCERPNQCPESRKKCDAIMAFLRTPEGQQSTADALKRGREFGLR